MTQPRKPTAMGQLKECGLFKLIPLKSAFFILTEYVKRKTGHSPEQLSIFEGVFLQSEGGKILFKDGQLEFEPHPFYVKKVKGWHEEMKRILKTYAGNLFVQKIREAIEERYNVLREQNEERGVTIFEVSVRDEQSSEITLQMAVLPSGKVMVFTPVQTESAETAAYEIVSYLESKGLIDF